MKRRAASPDGLQAFRDKTHVTRILVLREFQENPGATLKIIGERLGVTVQAVSMHARRLERDGLLGPRRTGEGHPLTPAGVQFLHEGLTRLKRTIDEALAPLVRIEYASALARTPVRAGERVGLLMEEGELVAHAGRNASSVGVAVEGAMPGEEVVVRDLQGFVDLQPGRLWVVKVPAPAEGGSRVVNTQRLRAYLKAQGVAPKRVGVVGAGAKALADRLKLAVNFDFAAAEAAFKAAELGVDALLLVQRDRLSEALGVIDERNASTLHRVPVELLEEPPHAPREVRRR